MNPAIHSQRLLDRFAESSAEIWLATAKGAAAYWSDAARRGATPWDVMDDAVRWIDAATCREHPRWHSPNEVVLECPVARLRDFSQGSRADVVPTLVLPPQAGHDSCIVDFSPEQSQMQVIRAAGLERAFSLDWIGATAQTRDAGIEDYLSFVERCIEHIGGPVNLVGDCQGGWLAAIYAALHPEQVHTLTLAGAPIDFHAGDPVIHNWVQALGSTDLALYRCVVEQGGGVLEGEHMLNGFIFIKPENEVAKQMQLLTHLHDPEHLERHHHFETWFKHVQDIPGAFYLWIVEHLFVANALVRGTLEIGGARVDLARIDCPLFLLGGARDHITPPAQVFAAADHVSTPRVDVFRHTSSGGHLGLFMGGEALREHWPPILAAIYERSRRDADGPAAERRARRRTRPRRPAIPAP
ncbi:MAG TPA: alpha/beta fold hydrolase [Solirubrobacteraceae bacterium]|nr:alpha/beta fold hydrolase [Solirubrobacteraceae bacterium]